MSEKLLTVPLKEEDMRELNVGDVVYLKGPIFTSRDMGHMAIRDKMENKEEMPESFEGSAIFHAGPVVRKREDGGWDLVVIGPTTSIRMEPYADMVGDIGAKAILGKGGMAEGTLEACKKYGYVYFQAAPGCAVKLAEGIEEIENVHWLELGVPEALWVLKAKKFGPLVVGMDTKGNSIYKDLKGKALDKVEKWYA